MDETVHEVDAPFHAYQALEAGLRQYSALKPARPLAPAARSSPSRGSPPPTRPRLASSIRFTRSPSGFLAERT